MDKDEFYRDILEGLALYTRSAFQRDVLKTLSRLDEPALAEALNKNQIASKLWLADALFDAVGAELGSVVVLGGWFGVLPAILLHDARFNIAHVTSLDIDPRCETVALALNDTHVRAGKFTAVTADMLDRDYARGASIADEAPKLIVNTSCEHVEAFDRWYRRIPDGQLLALQTNDYFACSEHVNCVPDLASFQRQAPMRDVLYAGERELRRYVRFMLIGRK